MVGVEFWKLFRLERQVHFSVPSVVVVVAEIVECLPVPLDVTHSAFCSLAGMDVGQMMVMRLLGVASRLGHTFPGEMNSAPPLACREGVDSSGSNDNFIEIQNAVAWVFRDTPLSG